MLAPNDQSVKRENLSLRHVRRKCLDCCGDLAKAVTWCTCDGIHSTRCECWPFRFGVQPTSFQAKHGDRLVNPEKMPPADVHLDDLPAAYEAASTHEIDAPGYQQPAVTVPKGASSRKYTDEQRKAMTERLRLARQKPR